MLESPEANLLQSLIDRITTVVPTIRFIEQDLGQLENYQSRPAVSWPCCLIDFEEFTFTDAQNFFNQIGEGIICFRVAHVKYTDSSNLTPALLREKSFQYYETEHKLYKALHGWNPPGYSKFLRRAALTEKRDDDIRVRILKFATSYKDDSAKPVTTRVARPNPVMTDDILPKEGIGFMMVNGEENIEPDDFVVS